MASITRVPKQLLDSAFPVRWIGTEAQRLALTATDVTTSDVQYLYLQKDDGLTPKLYMLSAIADTGLTWEMASGGVDALDMEKVTGLQDALDTKLEKADIIEATGTGIKVTAEDDSNVVTIAGTDASSTDKGVVRFATEEEYNTGTSTTEVPSVKQVKDSLALKLDKNFSGFTTVEDATETMLFAVYSDGQTYQVTAAQIKEFVTDPNELLFKGYFTTSEALIAAHATPDAGSYAIVEETDSVWVWDTDKAEWKNTQVSGVVSVNTQVIAGTGLEGGGTLASDVTLSVKYGNAEGTACQGNDPRLEDFIKWTGSADDRAALTVDNTTDEYGIRPYPSCYSSSNAPV